GTPRRGTPVLVPRQPIFSSTLINERRLSMRFSRGSDGSLKEYFEGCACEDTAESNRTFSRRKQIFFMARYRSGGVAIVLPSAGSCLEMGGTLIADRLSRLQLLERKNNRFS